MQHFWRSERLIVGLFWGVVSTAGQAQDAAAPAPPMESITIIGHRPNVADVPGSVHVVGQEEIRAFLQSDVMRVLRSVPGVYVQEEEGFGLRPNIGIRGSGLDRSARIALLEDGVLISPAPYAAPAAYYFPTQRRMSAIEVLKGPAAIAVGPRTTGGAVNLISTPMPDGFAADLDMRAGTLDTRDLHLTAGQGGGGFGWLVDTVQAENHGFKRIDGPAGIDMGPTGFDIEDYLVKLQLDNDSAARFYQSLRVKFGHTDQVSDETYLGLTDADFALDPNRRYAASAGDEFTSEHRQYQLSYLLESEGSWAAEVTAYRNEFARNWFKVESAGGAGISDILAAPETFGTQLDWLRGADSPDDAIVKRNNNRDYYSQGVQANVTWDFDRGGTGVVLTTGVRLHEDEEDRLQHDDRFRMQDGLLALTTSGAPGSQTNRVGSAEVRSWFVDSQISTKAWIVTPGVRVEHIEFERLDFSTADPTRAGGPTGIRQSSVSAVIPGIGALYRLGDRWRLLGGVHKGFNPPAPGSTAAEESSLNAEVGARYATDRLSFESLYFLSDYDNLVGTVTESTGGGGTIGDQFDGGEAIVQGLELSLSSGWTGLAGGNLSIPVSLRYTWTAEAQFENSFESEFEPWGDVVAGDELPYIPEHQLRAGIGLKHPQWGVNLAASYVDDMRAVAGQGELVPAETVPAYTIWDLLAQWQLTETLSTYVKVDNLLDETYIAARRPAGVRPGLERTAYLGVTYRLR